MPTYLIVYIYATAHEVTKQPGNWNWDVEPNDELKLRPINAQDGPGKG